MPDWATEFARELRYDEGDDKVVNGPGELFFANHEALAARGLSPDEQPVRVEFADVAAARDGTNALLALADPPTALFAADRLHTIGAVAALHVARRQHSVALVAFDDVALADVVDPPITVVDPEPRCARARRRRTAVCAHRRRERPPRTIVLPVALIARRSSESAAAPAL